MPTAMRAEAPVGSGDAPALAIEVQIAARGKVAPADEIAGWVDTVLGTVPVRGGGPAPAGPGAVCVRLAGAAESAELNARFRHREGPTNVLSFPGGEVAPGFTVWGDIVVCLPLVRSEATAQGKSAAAHLTHLVVHGVLHLLGYDHESAAEAEEMETLERRVLGRLGIADPYANEERSGRARVR
jgi:probable rRNA maturation factor